MSQKLLGPGPIGFLKLLEHAFEGFYGPLLGAGCFLELILTDATGGFLHITIKLALLGLIRRGREQAHKRIMLTAFACSVVFLASYLYYHFHFMIQVKFQGPDWGRWPYLTLLASHTLLAATVPFLASRTLWLGLKDRRAAHRRLARITFPIWLYVSVTGVLVYLILYVFTDSGDLALEALSIKP